jgi:hypothetical protein
MYQVSAPLLAAQDQQCEKQFEEHIKKRKHVVLLALGHELSRT